MLTGSCVKTARDGEKNMTHDSVNIFFTLLLKNLLLILHLEQIIATVFFIQSTPDNLNRKGLRYREFEENSRE